MPSSPPPSESTSTPLPPDFTSPRVAFASTPIPECPDSNHESLSRGEHSLSAQSSWEDRSMEDERWSENGRSSASFESGMDCSFFSVGAKHAIWNNCGGEDKCWICDDSENPRLLKYHEIIHRDHSAFEDYMKNKHLIDFNDLRDARNGILLCAVCQPLYSNPSYTTILSFPTDLLYFYNHEILDRARRRQLSIETGIVPPRCCVTAKMYQKHQLSPGVITKGSWGSYTRLNVYPQNQPITRLASLPVEIQKAWGGSPMAMIHHSNWGMNGWLTFGAIPRDVRIMFRKLQDIYSKSLTANDGEEKFLVRNGDDFVEDVSPNDLTDFDSNSGMGEERKFKDKHSDSSEDDEERPNRDHLLQDWLARIEYPPADLNNNGLRGRLPPNLLTTLPSLAPPSLSPSPHDRFVDPSLPLSPVLKTPMPISAGTKRKRRASA
ncbi:uncharacterized protein LY89DRAFT_787729 [Mollisia scopiformis]|uniref:Uncharacterized protein n=1 Tax=Mollisia scopiformis TaxID=149040 RepID=A0A132BE17_MOLSC|nr:uncharacterized protein LY89DRAFT_787729 [Mollisia scopiformis]KUJ10084.1 hypothetical protein LY89DRAFT_787729 [Mollisia scopiformis]